MSPGRDEDLDWLYGRGQTGAPDEPEPTRVFAPPPSSRARNRPQNPPQNSPQAQPRNPAQNPASRGPSASSAAGPPRPHPAVQPAPRPLPGSSDGSGDGSGGSAPRGAVKRRRSPVRRFFAVFGVFIALVLVWLIAVPIWAWNQISRVDNDPSGSRPDDQPGYTFLLLGSDSRAGLTKAQRKALGTGSAAGQRTDTIMLLSVPASGEPALISIPRDSYVSIPGNGKNKINAAYAFGGPKLITQTVEQDTGLKIDGYVEVGFGGFVNVIDALGGIRLCLPNAIKDKDAHIDLPKGCQNLSGANALGYVRERHADPLGDLGRVQRQRQMLSAMITKAASPSSVLNPVAYRNLSKAGAQSITLGDSTSAWEMLHFVLAMKRVSSGEGYTLTVPVSNANASTSAGSAVLWDTTRSKAMFADLARGDTSEMKKYAK